MADLLQEARHLIDLALSEDLGSQGDVSSSAVFTDQVSTARIISRQRAVIYGLFLLPEIFSQIDSELSGEFFVADGAEINQGDIICRISGPTEAILSAERTILNFLGFLSGIATKTHDFVELAASLGSTTILDTRKTLPGWRILSKAAVRAGGGHNHRMGLYDMVMLKDNHIDAAGSMTKAVAAVRAKHGSLYRIEVECRNLSDVREALGLKVDVAMLDNMDASACAEAVALRRAEFSDSKTAFEASGDMTLEKIIGFAGLGLDYISVGSLTHSVKNVNLSLGMVVNNEVHS